MNRVLTIVLGVVLVLVIAAGSFYGGMIYGKNQAQPAFPVLGEGGELRGMRGQLGMRPGGEVDAEAGQFLGRPGGMLFGEIQSIGDGELAVTDPSGEQIRVYVGETTLIQKQATVTLADLEVGETVVISGNRDDDGNITARSLQVSPGVGFFGQPDSTTQDGE